MQTSSRNDMNTSWRESKQIPGPHNIRDEVILVILSLWVLPEFSDDLSGFSPSARVTSGFIDPPAITFHSLELIP